MALHNCKTNLEVKVRNVMMIIMILLTIVMEAIITIKDAWTNFDSPIQYTLSHNYYNLLHKIKQMTKWHKG